VTGPLIGIVDYGMGNRRSVEKALTRVGARALISGDADALREAEGLILPGVGAFPEAMRNLRAAGLEDFLHERCTAAVPLLGICLGMQLLFERSTEREGAEGLGLLPGSVDRLEAGGRRLPHIGWNLVGWQRPTPLSAGLPDPCGFYHVHSYVPRPEHAEDVVGRADYGEAFASVVARPPLYGVQFHPEKSSTHGLRLLENFAGVCARVPGEAPA